MIVALLNESEELEKWKAMGFLLYLRPPVGAPEGSLMRIKGSGTEEGRISFYHRIFPELIKKANGTRSAVYVATD